MPFFILGGTDRGQKPSLGPCFAPGFFFNNFFGAVWILSFCAVVVGIKMNIAILVSLRFVFGCYHRFAIPALHDASVGEYVFLWPCRSFFSKQCLNFQKLCLREHWSMFSFVPVATAFWIFKLSIV